MTKREPNLITFNPKIFVYRDGRATKGVCWGIEIGDYPEVESSAAGFGTTIPDALRALAKELETLDSIQLEKTLGGLKFI